MKHLDQRGETIVEVVMALAILSLVLVSTYAVTSSATRLDRGAGQRTQAVNFLQQQAEALRIYRDNNTWSTFGTIIGNVAASGGGSFCMVNQVNVWTPVSSTDAGCSQDGINIAITRSPIGTVPYQEYQFDSTASWKLGNGTSITKLRVKLTSQE